jgi:flagellar hook-length control protein FliK
MALAEGSDASGAAATAVQQAGSAATPVATASALDAAQGPILQSIAGASDAAAAVPRVAASTLADAGDGGTHARGGAGDGGTGGSSGGNSSAAAQQLSANPSSAASTDTSPAATLRVGAAVDSADFPQDLADRVSFVVDSNLSSAKLQVNPPQLGPIELQIAVQGDHAQIWMSTHSAVTREALESSLPRLRDMLGAQGFGQVSVDISQRSFQERSASPAPYEWAPSAPRAAASASPQPISAPRISSAAVDAYA